MNAYRMVVNRYLEVLLLLSTNHALLTSKCLSPLQTTFCLQTHLTLYDSPPLGFSPAVSNTEHISTSSQDPSFVPSPYFLFPLNSTVAPVRNLEIILDIFLLLHPKSPKVLMSPPFTHPWIHLRFHASWTSPCSAFSHDYCKKPPMYVVSESLVSVPSNSSSRPAVPNLFGPRDQFRGRQFFYGLVGGGGEAGGGGSGSNVSNGETQMKLPSLAAHLLLCGPAPNRSPGVGEPCSRLLPKRGCWNTNLSMSTLPSGSSPTSLPWTIWSWICSSASSFYPVLSPGQASCTSPVLCAVSLQIFAQALSFCSLHA